MTPDIELLDLVFSYNWNNKLDCKAFTTIRLYNPAKHQIGVRVNIKLKSENRGIGTVTGVKIFMLHQLNEFIARIDTGYSKAECEKIILKMYPQIDFSKKQLVLLLIAKDDQKSSGIGSG